MSFLRTCLLSCSLLVSALANAALLSGGPPANDQCAGAIQLFSGPSCVPVIGDVAGATQSLQAVTCAGVPGTADDDVWYWFTATNASQQIEVVGSAGFDAVIDLRSGACDGVNVRCADLADAGGPEIMTAPGLTVGAVYLVRIYSRDATVPSTTTFSVCVHDPIAPVNNDCPNAIELIPDPVCQPITGTVAFATQSIPAIMCNGFTGNANDDVWFKFTATETTHTIDMVLGAGWEPVMDLRSGACNGTSIACADTPPMLATGLNVGETYYLRIYHYYTGVPNNSSFTICLQGAAPTGCDAVAGTMTADATPVCLVAGSATASATADGNAVVPTGYSTVYLFAQGAAQVIIDTDPAASFTATAADDYTINALVYDPLTFDPATDITLGVTSIDAVNAQLIQGGGSVCAGLDPSGAAITVEACATCDALAGTMTIDATPICLVSGSAAASATPDGNAVVPAGYTTVYLIAQGAGQLIIDTDVSTAFTATAAGDYTIHTLVYDPLTFDPAVDILVGSSTVAQVDALLIQGGGVICGSLDLAGAQVTVEECATCDALAGTMTADATPVCLVAGTVISATPDGNAVVPTGYQTIYLLSETATGTIPAASLTPVFTVTAAMDYSIHTLVYDPNTFDPVSFITFGSTIVPEVEAVLVQAGGLICASLDVTGATITVEVCATCDADAGTITADATPVCLSGGSAGISATPDLNSIIPPGYFTVYLLTQGAQFTIVNASATSNFTVNTADDYSIHTLVYDPNTLDLGSIVIGTTTIFEVDAMLIQGGGSICASLDLTGAAITVQDCVACDADAGTITADATPVCLTGVSVDISATPDGNAVVPTGFEVLYLISQDASQSIIDYDAVPLFTISVADDYTIHTLVYDPNTFDPLLDINLGATTVGQLDAIFVQGGGSICASVDLTGAAITVQACVPCDAIAGALIADATPVCLVGGSAAISATPDGNAVVPPGYQVIYVLTTGPGLVLAAADVAPSFTVSTVDTYTIHTLVYDPNTLDPLTYANAFDLDAALVQGGGAICASLDMVGALIEVNDCVVCDADAGTLTADETPVCLLGGQAQIGATPNGDTVVPDGYQTAFLLSQGPGLVIMEVGLGPVFTVNAAGSYTIHAIIYDPLTVDPSLIELGVTTVFDINGLLIQGGGQICGSVDMAGALISVNDCAPGNNDCVNAFPLAINLVNACPGASVTGDNTYATMDGGDAGCDAAGSDLLDVWYTFNSGANTTVAINFDQGTMEDRAIVISDGCAGNELLCLIQPTAPIDFATNTDTDYLVRIYSNLANGNGGQFFLCLTGAVPTVVCDGGSVQTTTGLFAVDVCQDADPDVIDFATTSTASQNYTFLLTDESNVIVAQLMGGSIDFNSAALGTYRVWGISHNGNLIGADPGLLATDVTTTGTCLDLSDNYVEVNVDICDGLADANTTAWNLFPNPSNGDFTLTYSGPDAFNTLEVVDMEGRVVHQQRDAMVHGQQLAVELKGELAMGVYTVRLTTNTGSTKLRLVVR